MATFVKFYTFVNGLATKQFNLDTDQIFVGLSNTAPVLTYTNYTSITEIAAGNGYVAGGIQSVQSSYGETAGVYKLVVPNVTFTAAGGNIGPFEYAVVYDKTNGQLIGYADYGTALTITNGNSFEVQFDQTNGILQIS